MPLLVCGQLAWLSQEDAGIPIPVSCQGSMVWSAGWGSQSRMPRDSFGESRVPIL